MPSSTHPPAMRVAPTDGGGASEGSSFSSSSLSQSQPQSTSRHRAKSSGGGLGLPPDPRPPASRRSISTSSSGGGGSSGGGHGHGAPPPRGFLSRLLTRKPMNVVVAEEEEGKLERRLGLWDLLAIGIGGTVGSGVFVLAGEIAASETLPAGPAVTLSFLFAGLGCALSGLSFAELASKIHQDGSSYAYAYVTLGEVFAFVAGCCLTLEYGVSSAAVARNWGDKLGAWIAHLKHDSSSSSDPPASASLWHPTSGGINLYAGAIELACTLVMLKGVNLSKLAVDVFTVGKLALVLFMTGGGLALYKPGHMRPFAPSGFRGVFRGSMRCFFGYLGYDEVCCLGGEAKSPAKNIPLAVMGTITAVTCLYVAAAWALVGMQPYALISPAAGFSEAFRSRGVNWAGDLVAIGELVTLPLVVLVSLLAQPRLQYAMAEDGLLPSVFAAVDGAGNLFVGTLICGLAGVVIAIFVPFAPLEDMISAGVLIAFNLTNTGLMVSRRAHPTKPTRSRWLALAFNVFAILAAFFWVKLTDSRWLPLNVLATLAAIAPLVVMERTCPDISVRGQQQQPPPPAYPPHSHDGSPAGHGQSQPPPPPSYFRTPLVPWLPAAGAAFNWFLLAQLTWQGLWMVLAYIAASLLLYFAYGYRHSLGAKTGWRQVLTSASIRRLSRHSTADVADPDLIAGLLEGDTGALGRTHSHSHSRAPKDEDGNGDGGAAAVGTRPLGGM